MASIAKAQRPGINPTRLSIYLTKQIDALSGIKSQREIAADLGYDRPNIMSMFKSGEAKVPLNKLPTLARSLGVDLGLLLRLGMEQYMGDDHAVWGEISRVMDRVVSDREFEIIRHIREVSNNSDPRLDDDRKITLTKAFGEGL